MSDLRFAEEVLVNGGVVFVDDVFNPEWPGVVEGVPAFLRAVPALVPFAFVEGSVSGVRVGLGHRFAAAWVRVRAAFGDG